MHSECSVNYEEPDSKVVLRSTKPKPAFSTCLSMMPSTPKMFKRTKRVIFQRRMNMMDRPLIVITFQGVLGDFFKGLNKQAKEKEILAKHKFEKMKTSMEEKLEFNQVNEVWQNLNLRSGAIEGLTYLCQHF